jgi:hypothetical protein
MGFLSRLTRQRPAGLTAEQKELLEQHRARAASAGEAGDEPELLVSTAIVAFATDAVIAQRDTVTSLVRRKLPWTFEDVSLMFALTYETAEASVLPFAMAFDWTLGPTLSTAERYARDNSAEPLRPLLKEALRALDELDSVEWSTNAARHRSRIRRLLDEAAEPSLDLSVIQPDDWGKAVRRKLKDVRRAGPLLSHFALATSARPTQKWTKQARELVRENEDVVRLLLDEAATSELRVAREWNFDGQRYLEYHWLSDGNANIVRGALWSLPLLQPTWAVEVVEQLVERGLQHMIRVANACVYALGQLGTPEAVGLLSALHLRVKDRGFQKLVHAAFDAAAANLGVSRTQLLERVVPEHELGADGRREIPIDGWAAVLTVEPSRVTTSWRDSDGKEQKTTPVALKEAPQLNEVKAAAKELRKALAAERARVESLFAEEAVWTLADWRAAYFEHPLVGALGRSLFWRFDDEVVLGQEAPAQAGEVRLWHPVFASADEIRELRRSLVERELVQPFKQAYRELYLIAPAELETELYSNRFAGHVLHYAQTYALLKERGWGGGALGPWDGGYETAVFREFHAHGLRAEWWLENPEEDGGGEGPLASLATTDQVRFVPLGRRAAGPIRLADVPPLVFSEAMRDVDLFVGVSSIGADPTWVDRGADRFTAYWHSFSFGDLDEAARVRRDVLAELIPKLRIADRLELEDAFLRVRGDLRTYRIHLRSGNILMEPNDQYLCIVAAPSAERPTSKVFLPFEDDRRLNVIISKAFLLANDTKIDDRSIRAQIER